MTTRMLSDLMCIVDDLENESEWDYNFVTNINEQKRQNKKLTGRQFRKLQEVHDKYFGRGSNRPLK